MDTVADDINLDSSLLAQVRALAHAHSALANLVSGIAEFRLIIDANFVVSDLLQKIRHPEWATAVEELIRCSVFVVIAPRWLETELVESALPQTAEKRGIPLEELKKHWGEYSKQLTWDETMTAPPVEIEGDVDPKDVPYVASQIMQDAVGVLSKDKHISRLGGTRLSFDFVLSARRYARTIVVSVGIRMSGMLISFVTVAALIEALKGLAILFSKLPPLVQAAVIATIIVAMLDPKSRIWIWAKLRGLAGFAAPVLSVIGEAVVNGRAMVERSERVASEHLLETQRHLTAAKAEAQVHSLPAIHTAQARKIRPQIKT